jgi:hypothetical protein
MLPPDHSPLKDTRTGWIGPRGMSGGWNSRQERGTGAEENTQRSQLLS